MSFLKKIGGLVSAAKAKVDEINNQPSGERIEVPLRLPERDYDDGERYFTFWHVKGEVYGLQKWNEIDRHGTFSITEFFIRTDEEDAHVRLEGADVPVADGQTVCVIFGHALTAKIGFPLRYLNAQMRQGVDIKRAHFSAATDTWFPPEEGMARIPIELDAYVKNGMK